MKDVMEQLVSVSQCKNFIVWHKLNADDLMLCVGHTQIEESLKTLQEVSDEYDLQINPKKCTIFAVRGHKKINESMNLSGIPVSTEYCYIGLMIDHSGSL
jgi:hypothetical protein